MGLHQVTWNVCILPVFQSSCQTRRQNFIRNFPIRTSRFKNSFFPSSVNEWNALDKDIVLSPSVDLFKRKLLTFIRPSKRSTFDNNHPNGVKFLTRLRVGLSHLREHKFKHNFQDTLNSLCPCSNETETTEHFLLHCQFYSEQRKHLFGSIVSTCNIRISSFTNSELVQLLLYGSESFNDNTNKFILKVTISYILKTERFTNQLLRFKSNKSAWL